MPANHYLPRRKTQMTIHEDELIREKNPLKEEGHLPDPGRDAASLEDINTF
ncbi:MAG: ferredoxin, partial [Gammaproteobacteria bacterium]|nr:ferredoxin [Gammaproteobacteria bacterium]